MTTLLVQLPAADGPRWVVRRTQDGATVDSSLPVTLAELLALPLAEARSVVEGATHPAGPGDGTAEGVRPLAPVDRQEVWAAGVTYRRSRDGRAEESAHASMYDLVYEADRPEVFFKSTPERVVPDGEPVGIRVDSGWDVPEPEVGLVVNSGGELFGYVAGNDMSSRSIEGENPLYLPQAKVYTRSCALGPGIVPAWELGDGPLGVSVRIDRAGETVFEGTTATDQMKRTFPDLMDWLTRALDFPAGVVLLTGTGLVPDSSFTLAEGDVVTVDVAGVGTLTNPVVVVGR
ncbi:fumarylacetoacetate hydrolase family protein [Cellulomonas aerilata]|uniref:Fumarylacetoacetate (FAA) hydrolase n=1 Tax=Cellulomonas aerilata TaxID=515326 RepID=A0A512D8J8_9CELL|nr:fumarylacetoacetate hydrolase family protein [Cellulomonas aerilata]GEO32796.1 fumarylacetoacetate (FAA) hydrolase [Cellulomonas aerilata]